MSRKSEIGYFTIPVGATRPSVISGLNFTFYWLAPVLGLPVLFVWLTQNIFWLMLVIPIGQVARRSNADPGLPRIIFHWLLSGSAFADRSERGTELISASRPGKHTDGMLHDGG